jgi:hypothetical protein
MKLYTYSLLTIKLFHEALIFYSFITVRLSYKEKVLLLRLAWPELLPCEWEGGCWPPVKLSKQKKDNNGQDE